MTTKKPKSDVFGVQARIDAVKRQEHKKKFSSFFGGTKEEKAPGEKKFNSMFDNNVNETEDRAKEQEQANDKLEKENRALREQIAKNLKG